MKTPHPYTVVVAVDFTPASDAAVVEAFRAAAEKPKSEVHAVHVLPPTGLTPTVRIRAQDVALEELPERMRAFVGAHATGIEGLRDTSLGIHVRLGKVLPAILQMTVDVRADLLVVGTHGHTGVVERVVLGSVAEDAVRSAHCPVLVARPVDYDGLSATPHVEPTCRDCLETRARTSGAEWWCPRHHQAHREIHTYSAVNPVHWTVGAADIYGAGAATRR